MGIVLSKLSSGPYVSRYNKHSYFVLMIGCFVNDTLIYIFKAYIGYSFCFDNVITYNGYMATIIQKHYYAFILFYNV